MGVQVPSLAPLTNLFELFELIYMNQSEMIDFFVIKKNRKDLFIVNIIKEKIEIEESLESRLRVICDFCNTTPTI